MAYHTGMPCIVVVLKASIEQFLQYNTWYIKRSIYSNLKSLKMTNIPALYSSWHATLLTWNLCWNRCDQLLLLFMSHFMSLGLCTSKKWSYYHNSPIPAVQCLVFDWRVWWSESLNAKYCTVHNDVIIH